MKKLVKGLVLLTVLASLILSGSSLTLAHDGWVQSNSPIVRVGDVAYMDLQFGNHGNMHRDYRLYWKWDASNPTFSLKVHPPKGAPIDLTSKVTYLGTPPGGTPQNLGYYVSSFLAEQRGAYITDARQTSILKYAQDPGPHRSIKGAKTVITAVDAISAGQGNKSSDFGRVVGQTLEIVPLSDPAQAYAGGNMTLQVLYQGQPQANQMISMVPRTKTPPATMGPPYDLMTDMSGKVTFQLQDPDYYLFTTHYTDNTQTAPEYIYTAYGATLTMIVTPKMPNHSPLGNALGPLGFDPDNWPVWAIAGILQVTILFLPQAWRRLRRRFGEAG